jgi:hypothetical protein
MMSDLTELLGPLTEVREVVETYRHHKIVLADWAEVFSVAIEALQAPVEAPPAAATLTDVVGELRTLLDTGLAGNADLVERIAAETAELFEAARPVGMPAPSDENWAFPVSTNRA